MNSTSISLPCSSASVGPGAQLFGLLIQTIIAAQCEISSPNMWPNDDGLNIKNIELQNYDFIVIGAGSAGSVVANRLSEESKSNVLLLEAGGNPSLESEIPTLSFSLFKTQYDWGYYIEKSKGFGLSIPAGIYMPRGKLLGGTSAINGMIYMRGNDEDYDNWKKLGNPGWNWENVLYYFKKSEDNQNPAFIGRYHRSGGLLKVEQFLYKDPIVTIFQTASEILGYRQVADLTGKTFVGYAYSQSTAYNGTRWSSAKAFLSSAKDRPNLHVVKHAFVNKININKNKEVTGVSFVLNGTKEYTVRVKKEVVLSAGAINSPQLLMLSGIGPAKHLRKNRIDVIKNLAVGYNLQDHIGILLGFTLHKSTAIPASIQDLLSSIYQYAVFRAGPLNSAVSFLGMIDSTGRNSSIPDIQIYYASIRKQSQDIGNALLLLGYEENITNQFITASQLNDIGIVEIVLLRPKSLGKVKLRSSKYDDKPKIYPNYLTNKYDVDTLIRGIRNQIQFVKTKIFKENEGEILRIRIPECDEIQYDSDAYWECYIRHLAQSIYHPVGTVKMGPEHDKTSVVNARLQVKGIKKLRVADASIMPMIISGNPNAPCMMIGEKAADLIKEDNL